jgi:CheY-like chemotaxis protein
LDVGFRVLHCADPESNIQNRCAVVTVRDSGIGIEAEVQHHIFETFIQADRSLDRSRGGLGLGLALVKGLVELHGGTVQASSLGLGCGAEFSFTLPLFTGGPASGRSGVQEEAAEPVSRTPDDPSLRILLVEDNPDAAETLRELLQLSGHDVVMAATGPAALETARHFVPEVVLCDIGLPGMDGYAVGRALKKDPATRAARLIALSGYGQEEDRRQALEAGFEEHLTKPVRLEDLERLLEGRCELPAA